MTLFLDHLLMLLHLLLIGFNLFGWMPKRTRRLHLMSMLATAASWVLLGFFFGLGYCPLTDWHWQVKENLGEENLPASFIKYLLDALFHTNLNAVMIDWLTGGLFAIAALISGWLNLRRQK